MSCVLFYINMSVSTKRIKCLIEQMNILNEFSKRGEQLIYVTPKVGIQSSKYIEKVSNIKIDKIISHHDLYYNVIDNKKYETWLKFNENHDIFDNIDKNSISKIIIFGGLLSESFGINRYKNKINDILKSQKCMTYRAQGHFITGLIQLIKLSNEYKIPVHEICFDPSENSISLFDYKPHLLKCHFAYDIPEYSLNRLDSYQYYLLNKKTNFELNKIFEICFGMTVYVKSREKIYDAIVNDLQNQNVKLFIFNKKLKIDTFIDRDEYLIYIEKSKFTLIIPSYDITQFSIFRFLEAIYLNCLPLIGKDVKIDSFVKSFNLDQNLVNELIVDYSTINTKMKNITEERRMFLLDYFKLKCLVFEKSFDTEV